MTIHVTMGEATTRLSEPVLAHAIRLDLRLVTADGKVRRYPAGTLG